MRRETIIGLALLLLAAAAPASAELYFWTDQNGIRHYTNQAPPSDVGAYGTSSEIGYDREEDQARTAKDTEAARKMRQEREAEEERQAREKGKGDSDAEAERKRLEAEKQALEEDLYRKRRTTSSRTQKQIQKVKEIDDQIEALEKSGGSPGEIERLKAQRKQIVEKFYNRSRYWKRGGQADLKEHQEIEKELEQLDQEEKEQKP